MGAFSMVKLWHFDTRRTGFLSEIFPSVWPDDCLNWNWKTRGFTKYGEKKPAVVNEYNDSTYDPQAPSANSWKPLVPDFQLLHVHKMMQFMDPSESKPSAVVLNSPQGHTKKWRWPGSYDGKAHNAISPSTIMMTNNHAQSSAPPRGGE